MASSDIEARLAAIEAAVCREVGRGAAPLMAATKGHLARAARALAASERPVVGIMTGFFVPTLDPPMAETDGPVGAAHLAAAFAACGWPVRLCTDAPCAGALTAALRGAGVASDPRVAVDVVERDGAPSASATVASVAGRWRAAGVTHVIAIERCGRAADGKSYTMRGIDVSASAILLDDLYTAGDWVRIAIGDGGNEVGMGALPRELIAASVPNGATIACVTPAEHLIVCGVSNWGAYGLLAALALLLPARAADLLATLTPAIDLHILETLVHDGPSADPVANVRGAWVDGFAHPVHAEVITKVLSAVQGAPAPA
ncbi:MAG TPA: glutamate cyclase domain-containing protein [Vineibacter sp.]|nr:glutamate cyclase domain-containing protein [Vineibacter sp.]